MQESILKLESLLESLTQVECFKDSANNDLRLIMQDIYFAVQFAKDPFESWSLMNNFQTEALMFIHDFKYCDAWAQKNKFIRELQALIFTFKLELKIVHLKEKIESLEQER